MGLESVYPLVYETEGRRTEGGGRKKVMDTRCAGWQPPQDRGKSRERLAGKRDRDWNVSPGRSWLGMSAAIQRGVDLGSSSSSSISVIHRGASGPTHGSQPRAQAGRHALEGQGNVETLHIICGISKKTLLIAPVIVGLSRCGLWDRKSDRNFSITPHLISVRGASPETSVFF